MNALDSARWHRASGHLDRLLDMEPRDRDTSLAAIRDTDPETAAYVEVLLDEHRRLTAERFLESEPDRPSEAPLAGVQLGAYTLEAPIGHGGMGSVWLASRSDGRFEGRVALKLLNAALVGRGGEERFRREGTILARLTHPHIARLIDAGLSPTGQAYLVLEHVDGDHIDTYCDEARLSVEARLRLVLDVLGAVEHAHARLIVHRDIKPSNVLVTRGGQVKLLDFSIAKLLEGEDGVPAGTVLTQEAAALLTPRYAAPEQVTGGPITTVTDVYALGVLLYELLAGRHPAGSDTRSPSDLAHAAAYGRPIRLSAALDGGDGADVEAIAARRSVTPERLRRALRGDLDTILNKALKKDPAERYPSVAALGDDLRRFLAHEPIRARPDTATYRTGKFVRRHWRGLSASAAALVVMIGLTAFYTTELAAERDRARLEASKSARISELLTDVLTGADPYRTPDVAEPTVANLLDYAAERVTTELADQPEVQADVLALIGRTFERLGRWQKAEPVLQRALEIARRAFGPDHVRIAQGLNNLGVLYRENGELARAQPLLEEALAMRRRLLGSLDKDVAVTLVELSRVRIDRGDRAQGGALLREALDIRRQVFGDEHRETATSKNDLGLLLWEEGDLAGAERLLTESLATNERLLGRDHTSVGTSESNLALVKIAQGDGPAAERLLRDALRISALVFGESHTDYAITLNGLAGAVEIQGRLTEARDLQERAVAIATSAYGADHNRTVTLQVNLARIRIELGDAAGTEAMLRHALRVRQEIFPSRHWRIAQAQSLLAAALVAQHRDAEAEALMRAADEGLPPVAGTQARERLANRARLVQLLERTGRASIADAYR